MKEPEFKYLREQIIFPFLMFVVFTLLLVELLVHAAEIITLN